VLSVTLEGSLGGGAWVHKNAGPPGPWGTSHRSLPPHVAQVQHCESVP